MESSGAPSASAGMTTRSKTAYRARSPSSDEGSGDDRHHTPPPSSADRKRHAAGDAPKLQPHWQHPQDWDMDTPRLPLSSMIDFANSPIESIEKTLERYGKHIDVTKLPGGEPALRDAERRVREYQRHKREAEEAIAAAVENERRKWEAQRAVEVDELQQQLLDTLTISERKQQERDRAAQRDRELADRRAADMEDKLNRLASESRLQQDRAAQLAAENEEQERTLRMYRNQMFSDTTIKTAPPPPTYRNYDRHSTSWRHSMTPDHRIPADAPPASLHSTPSPPVVTVAAVKNFKENPGECDGKDWDVYKLRFLACKKANKWSDEDAALALIGKLKGDALNIFRSRPQRKWTFDQLWSTLENRYEVDVPVHVQEDHISMIYQKPKQTIQAFMDEICKATHNKLDDPLREEQIALQQFRRGLSDSKVKNHLAKNVHLYHDIESACREATKYETRKKWANAPSLNARINAVSSDDGSKQREAQNTLHDLRVQLDRYKRQMPAEDKPSTSRPANQESSNRGRGNGNRRGSNRRSYAEPPQHWNAPGNGGPPPNPFSFPPPPSGHQSQFQPSWQQQQIGQNFHRPQGHPPNMAMPPSATFNFEPSVAPLNIFSVPAPGQQTMTTATAGRGRQGDAPRPFAQQQRQGYDPQPMVQQQLQEAQSLMPTLSSQAPVPSMTFVPTAAFTPTTSSADVQSQQTST